MAVTPFVLPNPAAILLAVCLLGSQEDGKGHLSREMGYFLPGKLRL